MTEAVVEPVLLTVGHGTLDDEQLGDLLVGAGVERLVDVRRFPGSRSNPAAQRPALEALAQARGFDYRWEERLGGRTRRPTGVLLGTPGRHGPLTWSRMCPSR